MELYVKISFISTFFMVLIHDFIRCVDFTHKQTQQVMTSQILIRFND